MLSSTNYMYFFSTKSERCIFLVFLVQSGMEKLCEVYDGEHKGYSIRQEEANYKGMKVERLRKAMISIIPLCTFFHQLEIAFSLR